MQKIWISVIPSKIKGKKRLWNLVVRTLSFRQLRASWVDKHLSIVMTTLKRLHRLDGNINSERHTRYLWKHQVLLQQFLLCSSEITYFTYTAYHSSPLPPVFHLPADMPPCILLVTSHTPKFHILHPLLIPAPQHCWAALYLSKTTVVIINFLTNPLFLSFPNPQDFCAELQTEYISLTVLEAAGRICLCERLASW